MTELYQATVIAGAMGDANLVRECLSRLWQPAAHAKQQKILWDLAVREAQAWAMHGYLDEALTQLEYWRDTPEARTESHFEGRAAVVCLFARDIERARLHYQKSVAAAPEDITPRIDRALMEARFGPINIATQAFAEVRPLMSNTQPGRNLVPGILACRKQQSEALELLTTSVDEFVGYAQNGAAAWSILSYCVGWWALALHQHGHTNFARKAVAAVAPILLNALHTDLVTELISAELVPGDTTLSPFPVPLKQGEQAIRSSSELTEHIGFKTRCVRGVNALQAVLKYRDEYAKNKGLYPFLIGSNHEVSDLLENISPPDDEGKSGLSAARELNVDQWFKDHKIKPPKSWPRQTIPPTQTLTALFDTLSGKLKPEIHIGFINVDAPSEIFVKLGYGDWNDCPAAPVHTALHTYWREKFGAEPIAISNAIVECIVSKPAPDKTASLQLAAEQNAYCYDIVEQGVGSVAKLATCLFEASYWYFWWD